MRRCTAGKMELLRSTKADVVGLDWATDMADARRVLGADVKVQGNVDPMVLFGTEEAIRAEVARCLHAAGPRGHILNVGHGVPQVSERASKQGREDSTAATPCASHGCLPGCSSKRRMFGVRTSVRMR